MQISAQGIVATVAENVRLSNQYTKVPIDTAVDKQNSTPPPQPTTTPKVEVVEDKPKLQTKATGEFTSIR